MNSSITEEVITIENNSQIRVSLQLYEGKEYIAIRLFRLSKKEDYYPTKAGINIPAGKCADLQHVLKSLKKHSNKNRLENLKQIPHKLFETITKRTIKNSSNQEEEK